MASFSKRVPLGRTRFLPALRPPRACPGVWADPLSLAATRGITVVFLSSGYLDVSVPRVAPPCGVHGLQPCGLPHSDTCGSTVVCTSPQLFAAYRVLRHLWEPRHPPYALRCFLLFRRSPRLRTPAASAILSLPVPVLSMNFSAGPLRSRAHQGTGAPVRFLRAPAPGRRAGGAGVEPAARSAPPHGRPPVIIESLPMPCRGEYRIRTDDP